MSAGGQGALAAALSATRADVAALVRDVPDFPVPGVVFKDITPLLADGAAFARSVHALSAVLPGDVSVVAGVESRGFVLGAALALHRGCGFVPVRKGGKLPGDTLAVGYELEYGSAVLEVHADAFVKGQRVAVVDDVLATGGTAAAACDLVERAGGQVVAFAVLLEIGFLAGRDRLAGRALVTAATL